MTSHYPGQSARVNPPAPPPRQRELQWDEATVCRVLQAVRPASLRTLLRGLLLTAIRQPRTVCDIDDGGYMLLAAAVPVVAGHAGVDRRTVQRARQAAAGIVDHDTDGHTDSHWCVRLAAVLPPQAIAWLRDSVGIVAETAAAEPDTGGGVGVAFSTPGAAFVAPGGGKCRGDIATPDIYMLKSNTASSAGLAELREVARQHGYSMTRDTWDGARLDDQAIQQPQVVAAIARAAIADGIILSGDDAEYRVCVAAVVAASKQYPWSYLRQLLLQRQHLTTRAKPSQLQQAARLYEQATGQPYRPAAGTAVPEIADGEQAWAGLCAAMRRHSQQYERPAIAAAVGPRAYAAAQQVGISRIADRQQHTERMIRAEFLAAFAAQPQPQEVTQS